MCREKRRQTYSDGVPPDLCHANTRGKGCCSAQAHISILQHQESSTYTEPRPDAATCKTNKDTHLSTCTKRSCCRVLYEQKAEENMLSYIVQTRKRRETFSKRTKSIIKKARELSALTASQVLVLIVDESGRVYTFATHKLRSIITECLKRC